MKKLAKLLFKYRSYTPIPFLLSMLVFYNGTTTSLIIGSLIVVFGESLRFLAIAYIGEKTRSTKNFKVDYLVTNGPFAYVRNPLYLSNILIYSGFGIMSLSLFPYLQIAAVCFFCFQYYLIIIEEEKYLEDKFGKRYTNYKNSAHRFLPKFTPYISDIDSIVAPNYKIGFQSEIRTFQALFSVGVLNIMMHLVK